jgi:Flp pilus assembly protein TadG
MRHLRRLRSQDGQAMVEFAFVALPFILLVLAIVQLGFFFQAKSTLRDAVRAAARQASLCRTPTATTPTTVYTGIVGSSLNPTKTPAPTISFGPSGCAVGSKVTVTGTYPFSVKVAGWVLIPATDLTSTAVTIVE